MEFEKITLGHGGGAEPLALSLSYVIEEGFPVSDLKRITKSINRESKKLKVPIVTGDTKVVEKGSLNKIIINTCGIGIVKKPILNDDIKEGDRIIISGSVGEHGISLLAKRFGLKTKLKSDCDSVLKIVREALKIGGITAMKDPTRGGLAACLNEIAKKSGKALYIYESEIPIKKEVLAVSEILGVDPLQTACEGRVVIFAKKDYAEEILERIKKFNKKASIIGEVIKQPKGKVILETVVGGRRFLEAPIGELYPRIC
jgi:hydrogenase expression/formation protein HypE